MKPRPRRLPDWAARPEIEQIELIRSGLPKAALSQLARTLGLPPRELIIRLGLQPARVSRELKSLKRLSPVVSERLIRTARLLLSAGLVFTELEASAAWLQAPAGGLNGLRPIDFLDTEPGVRLVEKMLKGLAYGNVL